MKGRPRWSGALIGLVLAAALFGVLGWPLLATLLAALGDGPEGATGGALLVSEASGGVRRPLGLAIESLRLVGATEIMALPVGLALALVLFRTDAWGRRGLLALLGVAAFVPLPLHATAWLGAFGNAGRAQVIGGSPWLVGWSGAAFVHAAAALPWVVFLAGVGFLTVEPELEEAALLDLSAGWVLWRVTLRRGIGAIAAAAVGVAVLTAGDMTVTDLLQVRTYAEEAYLQYNLGNGPGAAAAVALPPVVVLGGLIAWGVHALLSADPARLASAASRARVWRLGRGRLPMGLLAWIVVGNAIALPVYSLLWRAGRVGGRAAIGRAPGWSMAGLAGTLGYAWGEAAGPLGQSLAVALAGASVAVVLAWLLAWSARTSRVWRGVAAGTLALALALPGPVAGMALVFAYRDWPLVYDSAVMLVLAAILRILPYALLIVWPATRSIAPAFLDAAAVDGLGPIGRAVRVGLPLTRGALVAAWGVSFALALGELPATNLVAPPGLTPLSVVIWGLLHTGVESHLAGVVLVMLGAVSMAGVFAALTLKGLSVRSDRGRRDLS